MYPSDESISGEISPGDHQTIQTIRSFISDSLKPDDVLVCPLAVGKHVDHQLVRQALEGLNRPLIYFADIPYIFNYPEQFAAEKLNFQSQSFPLSQGSLTTWKTSIESYRSQLGGLFKDSLDMHTRIDSYFKANEGIHLLIPT